MWTNDANDDVGVDLYLMVVAEVLNKSMTDLPTGIVDEHLMLMRLRHRRNVLLLRHPQSVAEIINIKDLTGQPNPILKPDLSSIIF